jgi:hypothetical protein
MNREKRYLLKRENWEKQERERELKEINKVRRKWYNFYFLPF